jgi:hypothetical protein
MRELTLDELRRRGSAWLDSEREPTAEEVLRDQVRALKADNAALTTRVAAHERQVRELVEMHRG